MTPAGPGRLRSKRTRRRTGLCPWTIASAGERSGSRSTRRSGRALLLPPARHPRGSHGFKELVDELGAPNGGAASHHGSWSTAPFFIKQVVDTFAQKNASHGGRHRLLRDLLLRPTPHRRRARSREPASFGRRPRHHRRAPRGISSARSWPTRWANFWRRWLDRDATTIAGVVSGVALFFGASSVFIHVQMSSTTSSKQPVDIATGSSGCCGVRWHSPLPSGSACWSPPRCCPTWQFRPLTTCSRSVASRRVGSGCGICTQRRFGAGTACDRLRRGVPIHVHHRAPWRAVLAGAALTTALVAVGTRCCLVPRPALVRQHLRGGQLPPGPAALFLLPVDDPALRGGPSSGFSETGYSPSVESDNQEQPPVTASGCSIVNCDRRRSPPRLPVGIAAASWRPRPLAPSCRRSPGSPRWGRHRGCGVCGTAYSAEASRSALSGPDKLRSFSRRVSAEGPEPRYRTAQRPHP